MAYVSKFNLFDQEIDIKDSQARDTMNDLNTRLTAAEKVINRKNIIIVADSFGNYPTESSSYIAKLKDLFPHTIYSTAVNGAGFAKPGNTFQQNLTTLVNSLDDNVLDTIDAVYVLGGYNDYPYRDNIRNSAQLFVNYCKNTLPNAKLYVGFISYHTDRSIVAYLYETMRTYQTLSDLGITYLPGSDQIYRRLSIGTDGLHPNDYGASVLARGVYSLIMTGSANIATEQRTLSYNRGQLISSLDGLTSINEFRRSGTVYYFAVSDNYIVINFKSPQNFTITRIIELCIFTNADVTWRGKNIGAAVSVQAVIGSVRQTVTLKYGEGQTLWMFIPSDPSFTNVSSITIMSNWYACMDDFYSC
jgi:lysophospholipase L1-like esterase